MRHWILGFVLCLAWDLMGCPPSWCQTKLLRFPDIHEDQIVFCYAGDLWHVDADGGTAARLTAHPGIEVFPKFSPDGTKVAFTGQYDGDEQVYWIESIGGVPRQMTFYPANGPLPDRWGLDNQVYGWTVGGDAILFRSTRYGWGLTDTRLFTAAVQGGLPQPLPMRVSGAGDFSPDGTQVVFSPLVRDFRTWKRYEGGWAQDLYIVDLRSKTARRITDHRRTDRDPMWIGDRIYFASDRSDTLNLYYYDTKSGQTHQVTDSTTFDIRWPSKGESEIVYELGGELHVLDTTHQRTRKVEIVVPTDGLAMRPHRLSAEHAMEHYSLGPTGKRALIAARGDIFSVPAEKGPVRNLTRSSGAHDKWPVWSPDGARIAYLSDADGEEELYLYDIASGKSQQVTDDGAAMRYRPAWSPDGQHIAFSDKDGRLLVVNVASHAMRTIADDTEGAIQDYTWSPDSQWIAFSMGNANDMNTICIWSLRDESLHRVTDDLFDCRSPSWDSAGKYLYYLSSRDFAPQIGSREWNFVQNRQVGIFALALNEGVKHPFPDESDEIEATGKKDASGEEDKDPEDEQDDESDDDDPDDGEGDGQNDHAVADDDLSPLDTVIRFFESEEEKPSRQRKPAGKSAKGDDGKKEDSPEVRIDFDGLAARVTRVPVEAHNLDGLAAVKGHLLYARSAAFYYGRSPERPTDLMSFSIKDRKESVLAEDIHGFELSQDGRKVLFRSGGKLQIRDINPTAAPAKPVPTSGLSVVVDPRQEWHQIFGEVWRRFRDFFYVENMHGYDWEALRRQYEPLLDHVAHRSDLNYVIGEMIAELNVGHAYIAGGDYDRPPRPDTALPGAIFELDRDAGRYRLARIYPGHNEETLYRSPLTEVGVDIRAGEYVLTIDGEDLTADRNPYELLRFKSSQPVTFTVNQRPETEGARDVSFKPVASETNLIYLDMVLANRDRVLAATKGDVGYLHLPDMGANGIREFEKWFPGQIRKKGLIIDVRSNGGGNVSQMILERLGRKLLATGQPRADDTTNTYPQTVFHGHFVCLLDEDSASDGDIFPAMFREKELGPLIGKRSWGGVIGITNRGMLIDGGSVNVPEFGFASKDGEWIIEGEGVYPDIDVDNDPQALMEGRDPQLDMAIQVIQRKIRLQPMNLPERPAPPDRSKHSSR